MSSHLIKKTPIIRTLTVSDSRKMVSLVKKFASETNNAWIKNVVKQSNNEDDSQENEESGIIGFFSDLFVQIIDHFQEDITEWFANLCGMTIEEYLKQPIDTDFEVIEQIKKQPESERFFSKACAVFKTQIFIENIMTKLKEKFGSLTA